MKMLSVVMKNATKIFAQSFGSRVHDINRAK